MNVNRSFILRRANITILAATIISVIALVAVGSVTSMMLSAKLAHRKQIMKYSVRPVGDNYEIWLGDKCLATCSSLDQVTYLISLLNK